MAEHSVTGDYYRRIAAARKPVFSIGTLAMAVTMVAAILGASVDTGVLPPIVHAMIAYGAIACNLAAAEDRNRRAHRNPAASSTRSIARSSRERRRSSSSPGVVQGLPRPAPAADRGAARAPRRARRAPRLRSADGRSVRQPRDRRDAARRRRRSRVFGRPTRAIADSADWLAIVDRFGIVSERAVLLDALTVDAEPGDAVHARDRAAARRGPRARRGAGARGRAAGIDRGTRRSRQLDAGGCACACGSAARMALDPARAAARACQRRRCRRGQARALGADMRAIAAERGIGAGRGRRPTRRSPRAVAGPGPRRSNRRPAGLNRSAAPATAVRAGLSASATDTSA